jgi:hypothetical protein
VESYRLLPEGGPRDAGWVLERDGTLLSLTDPGGQVVFESEPAHRVVDLWYLGGAGEIRLAPAHACLAFRRHRDAVAAVRAAAEAGLVSDAEGRGGVRRRAAGAVRDGLVMSGVAGGLFGLYCWWAFTAGDPPPGTWLAWVLKWFGVCVGWALLVLLALAAAGAEIARVGLRLRSWVRRIERAAAG